MSTLMSMPMFSSSNSCRSNDWIFGWTKHLVFAKVSFSYHDTNPSNENRHSWRLNQSACWSICVCVCTRVGVFMHRSLRTDDRNTLSRRCTNSVMRRRLTPINAFCRTHTMHHQSIEKTKTKQRITLTLMSSVEVVGISRWIALKSISNDSVVDCCSNMFYGQENIFFSSVTTINSRVLFFGYFK